MPFGFPSGQRLVDIICNSLIPGSDSSWRPTWLEHPIALTIRWLNKRFSQQANKKFAEALLKSGEGSIDAFLERQEGEFLEIGKAAIAGFLLPFEREESLYVDLTINRLESAFIGEREKDATKNNWYQLLWGALSAPLTHFTGKHLKIITFNYDRSLEHYLLNCLKNNFAGKKDAEYVTLMPPIAHVHGRLGQLPWQAPGDARENANVPYGFVAKKSSDGDTETQLIAKKEEWFDRARENITVIHETEETDELKQAREWIGECSRLYFLGFGYHPSNIERLQIESLPGKKRDIKGTRQGLSLERRRDVMRVVSNASTTDISKGLVHANNYDFLHDHVDLTMR